MYERRSFEQWTHTARILQLIANSNRNTEEFPDQFPLEAFHPFMADKSPRDQIEEISFEDAAAMLKAYGAKHDG